MTTHPIERTPRRQQIVDALLAAGCQCPNERPTWSWIDNSAVRCHCGMTVIIDAICPTCGAPMRGVEDVTQ